MNTLLHGQNTDQRIVAVQQKDDRTMRLYFREDAGVRFDDDTFYPFFFLTERKYLDGFSKKHWLKKLEGNGFFGHVCAFEEWTVMWEAIRYMLEQYNRIALTKAASYPDLGFLHLYTDPVTQYLMQTGRTLFKGMEFRDLIRMQIDIETFTSARYKFPNATRPGDRVILIALSDSTGWEYLIDGKKLDEREMLLELARLIKERDPDVIEGHNIYDFDIPYILKRCELHALALNIGRQDAPPRSFDSRSSFIEYTFTDIPGRHVIDTLLLVRNYDMGKRDMESYGLKYAAKYFDISPPDRVYIKGDRISWHWEHDVLPLMEYAMDDVRETRALSERLSGTSFYLTQMLPFSYSQVARMGSAAKIEGLMVREYLRMKNTLPRPQEGTQTTGGYTDIFTIGILGPVLHVDVESLYPSIMLRHHVAPASDTLGVFRDLLRYLTSRRLETKQEMKREQDLAERSRLDAMQSSLKILINSFYGYLGYFRGLFNDYAQADFVTKTGQQLLRQMIEFIQSAGGQVIEVDTDGIFFVPPPHVRGEESEGKFVQRLSASMPEGISVALDGRYRMMLSYKKKNYALLGYDNRVKVKGSSLTSRSMERFGRNYILQCIDFLLNNNIEAVHGLYTGLQHTIAAHKLDVKDFVRVEALRDPLHVYQQEVASGKRNRSAAYEVALTLDRPFKPGDRVAYYITGTDQSPRSFDNCKPAELWDPNFPDENIPYYLRRLDEFSEKFRPFFLPQDFRSVFSTDDLFPFSSKGISLVTSPVEPEETEETSEGRQSDYGIWLDE